MINQTTLTYLIYFLIAAAAILVAEAIYVALSRRRSLYGTVNRRLKYHEKGETVENTLQRLRQERGLTAEGDYRLPWIALNRLFLQSGMQGEFTSFMGIFIVLGMTAGVIVYLVTFSLALGLIIAAALMTVFPTLILMRLRARRKSRFAEQLPDAVDIIVRSLRAGHPTPVSLALAGRELPDPVGTEFGIAADEMTYGMDLSTAMRNMLERVGLDDLRLIVVSMSIQSRTGGNLAEILGNLSKVIRERFKLRRRVKAISAEGRLSAIALSIFPFGLFAVVNLLSPSFYGDVWDHWMVTPLIVGMLMLMAVGDIIMYRMVNFDF